MDPKTQGSPEAEEGWPAAKVPQADRGLKHGGALDKLLSWRLKSQKAYAHHQSSSSIAGEGNEASLNSEVVLTRTPFTTGHSFRCEKHPEHRLLRLASWQRARHGRAPAPERLQATGEHKNAHLGQGPCAGGPPSAPLGERVLAPIKKAVCTCSWHACDTCHMGFLFPFPSGASAVAVPWAPRAPKQPASPGSPEHPARGHAAAGSFQASLAARAHSWHAPAEAGGL